MNTGSCSIRVVLPFALVVFTALGACDDAQEYDGSYDRPDAMSDALDGETIDADPIELRRAAAANISDEVLKYLGQAEIKETISLGTAGSAFVFDSESGPICIDGTDFYASTDDGDGDDLLLFFQGGGACWSTKCLATGGAGNPGFPSVLPPLSRADEINPFASFNKVYFPYCDGSLFGGDAEYDDDDDGEIDRIHHGLQNLSAGLDVALAEYPNPGRIVITGISAGGFGTLLATNIVRKAYPEAEILVFNDSGVGVLYGEDDLDFLPERLEEWNITGLVPDTCEDCLTTGHITPLYNWQLNNDPTMRIATYSSFNDGVIAGIFLERDPEEFEDDLIEQMTAVHNAIPDRFSAFLFDGSGHTAPLTGLYADLMVNGVSLYDWLTCFLDNDTSCWDLEVDGDQLP